MYKENLKGNKMGVLMKKKINLRTHGSIPLLCRLSSDKCLEEYKILITFYLLFASKFNLDNNCEYFRKLKSNNSFLGITNYEYMDFWSDFDEDPEEIFSIIKEMSQKTNKDIFVFSLERLNKNSLLSIFKENSENVTLINISEDEEEAIKELLLEDQNKAEVFNFINEEIESKRRELLSLGSDNPKLRLSNI